MKTVVPNWHNGFVIRGKFGNFAVDKFNRLMDFILSDGSRVNSRGFRMNVAGIRLERFHANPMMLYEHDPERAIGRWENVRVDGDKLLAAPVFDLGDPVGKEVARKVDDNFLRATSIGIIPLKMDYVDDEYVMTESELLESSMVSLPSDAGAIRMYNEKMEELSFDEVRMCFNLSNNNKKEKMSEFFKLSQKTEVSLQLSADYTPKDVELAVAEKDMEIEALRTKLTAVEKQARADYFESAVKSGKITEAERLSLEKMADKGCFDEVKAMVGGKADTPTSTLADKVRGTSLAAERAEWDYIKWMKEDPKGLKKLKLENPGEFERLQQTIKK